MRMVSPYCMKPVFGGAVLDHLDGALLGDAA
jgi:hypothetical protein